MLPFVVLVFCVFLMISTFIKLYGLGWFTWVLRLRVLPLFDFLVCLFDLCLIWWGVSRAWGGSCVQIVGLCWLVALLLRFGFYFLWASFRVGTCALAYLCRVVRSVLCSWSVGFYCCE